MSDFVIVGDTDKYEGCLVYVCGTYDNTNKILHRMLNNPTENDKKIMNGYRNLRIEEVPEEDCWWCGNCD